MKNLECVDCGGSSSLIEDQIKLEILEKHGYEVLNEFIDSVNEVGKRNPQIAHVLLGEGAEILDKFGIETFNRMCGILKNVEEEDVEEVCIHYRDILESCGVKVLEKILSSRKKITDPLEAFTTDLYEKKFMIIPRIYLIGGMHSLETILKLSEKIADAHEDKRFARELFRSSPEILEKYEKNKLNLLDKIADAVENVAKDDAEAAYRLFIKSPEVLDEFEKRNVIDYLDNVIEAIKDISKESGRLAEKIFYNGPELLEKLKIEKFKLLTTIIKKASEKDIESANYLYDAALKINVDEFEIFRKISEFGLKVGEDDTIPMRTIFANIYETSKNYKEINTIEDLNKIIELGELFIKKDSKVAKKLILNGPEIIKSYKEQNVQIDYVLQLCKTISNDAEGSYDLLKVSPKILKECERNIFEEVYKLGCRLGDKARFFRSAYGILESYTKNNVSKHLEEIFRICEQKPPGFAKEIFEKGSTILKDHDIEDFKRAIELVDVVYNKENLHGSLLFDKIDKIMRYNLIALEKIVESWEEIMPEKYLARDFITSAPKILEKYGLETLMKVKEFRNYLKILEYYEENELTEHLDFVLEFCDKVKKTDFPSANLLFERVGAEILKYGGHEALEKSVSLWEKIISKNKRDLARSFLEASPEIMKVGGLDGLEKVVEMNLPIENEFIARTKIEVAAKFIENFGGLDVLEKFAELGEELAKKGCSVYEIEELFFIKSEALELYKENEVIGNLDKIITIAKEIAKKDTNTAIKFFESGYKTLVAYKQNGTEDHLDQVVELSVNLIKEDQPKKGIALFEKGSNIVDKIDCKQLESIVKGIQNHYIIYWWLDVSAEIITNYGLDAFNKINNEFNQLFKKELRMNEIIDDREILIHSFIKHSPKILRYEFEIIENLYEFGRELIKNGDKLSFEAYVFFKHELPDFLETYEKEGLIDLVKYIIKIGGIMADTDSSEIHDKIIDFVKEEGREILKTYKEKNLTEYLDYIVKLCKISGRHAEIIFEDGPEILEEYEQRDIMNKLPKIVELCKKKPEETYSIFKNVPDIYNALIKQ